MTKREFVRRCAEATNLSQRQVSDVLQYIVNYIKETLMSTHSVQCFGLGKLKVVQRTSKNHYNIQTGEICPARNYQTIKFEPGIEMKKILI